MSDLFSAENERSELVPGFSAFDRLHWRACRASVLRYRAMINGVSAPGESCMLPIPARAAIQTLTRRPSEFQREISFSSSLCLPTVGRRSALRPIDR
jgi:hypothetical protein